MHPIRRNPILLALALLFALTLAMFFDLLAGGGTRVAGNGGTDLFRQFIAWRAFGFHELAEGRLALWNPYVYSGAPYFGGFQSALLYPPNWLFLILPLPAAINASIALHVFAMGAFTCLWVARRGLHPAAAFLAGALTMFGGAYFSHIYAGHLPNLCTMVWAPLLLLAIDGLWERPGLGWCLLGAFATAMQIFAGHPQYVLYTAITAGLYCALRLIGAKNRGRLLAGLAGIALGGAALAAVQLFAGLQANAVTIRNTALSFRQAAVFSFPPENFLTLFAPGFFGDMVRWPYWGRWFLWEESLFIGVTGFALAAYGAARGEKKSSRIAVAMTLALLLLALGASTPLFRILYDFAPGFGRARGISKFIFPASLFLSLLAAMGFDRLWRTRRAGRPAVFALLGAGVALALAALVISRTDWLTVLQSMRQTRESRLPADLFGNGEFAAGARDFAVRSLLIAAGSCLALGGLLAWMRREPRAIYGIAALAVLEVFAFARNSRDSFDSASATDTQLQSFLARNPGDYRIADGIDPGNNGYLHGARDLSGDDTSEVRRYAELMAFLQGADPDHPVQNQPVARIDPLYAMLRLRYALLPEGDQARLVEARDPLPHALLVGRYRVIAGRDAIFAAMREPEFDPRREAILERAPAPSPAGDEAAGAVRVVAETTDSLTLEADTPRPAILLITDVYAPGWRAVSLPGSAQARYELMPADYVLRAVPLSPGHHRLRVEYRPTAFSVGKVISLFALAGYAAALGLWWRRRSAPPGRSAGNP